MVLVGPLNMFDRAFLLLKLGRFHFLGGGILLFLAGVQIAILDGADPQPLRIVLGYAILFGAHLSVSYTNDYFDREADSFNVSSPFSGGSGVLLKHPEMARATIVTGIALIVLSFVAAAVFMALYGFDPFLLAMVVLGNVLGWSYTAPPLRLAYTGFGEVSTSLSVGILVTLFGFYVMAGSLSWTFFVYAVPMSLYGTIFILDVQIPDMEADVLGGKRTIVTVIGRRFSFAAIAVLALVSTLGILAVGMTGDGSLPFSMRWIAVLSLLPLVVSVVPFLSRDTGKRGAARNATMVMGSVFTLVGLIDIYLLLELLEVL